MIGFDRLAIPFALALAMALAGCSSLPDRTPVAIGLQAAKSVNVGAGGDPSPIVVRLYELKETSAFDNASYFDFDDEAGTLGAALVGTHEYEVLPGEDQKIDIELSADARYLGVIAAFRDIDTARWRDVAAIKPGKANQLKISVANLEVDVEALPTHWWRLK